MMAPHEDDTQAIDAGDDRACCDATFDPEWYLIRYPDVAAAYFNPSEHYRVYGRAEGRFPNPNSELRARGEFLDAAWYYARYPDVAATGADPAWHYLLYGRIEGRYPHADREPRDIWNTRFDPIWYRARNADLHPYDDDPLEHFRRVGLLEGRAANAAEEDRAAWRSIFDPDWYLVRNPDVARRGIAPLEHFITEGLVDRRRPNASIVLPSEPVTAARIERLKGGGFASEVVLFVTHAPDGVIKPHVEHHVACFHRCGIECVLIVVCNRMDVSVTGAAADIAEHVFQRANAGFDFAAWAHVLRLHPALMGAEILYLVNDSVFGPTSPEAFALVINRVRASEADLVGLTDNADRGWHVQSYFLALKRRFLASEMGRNFFESVVSFSHKNDVVNEYETQLARYALGAQFSVEVLFPTPDWLNATLHNWRRLLRAGFPYLKVGTARGLVPNVETADWRTEMAVRGYDIRMADGTLAQMALEAPGNAKAHCEPASEAGRRCRAEMHAFLAEGGVVKFQAAEAEPAVSLLAVLDGRPERLLQFLRALSEINQVRIEVVIVDNASTDDTYDVLKRLEGVTVVTNVAPLPRSRAIRQGIARSRARIVVFLNLDGWDATYPNIPFPEAAPHHGPVSLEAHDFAEALAFASAPGFGLTYRACAGPDGAPGQAFAINYRDRRIGTAHAMLRDEAWSGSEWFANHCDTDCNNFHVV